jgi:hypothetical protein
MNLTIIDHRIERSRCKSQPWVERTAGILDCGKILRIGPVVMDNRILGYQVTIESSSKNGHSTVYEADSWRDAYYRVMDVFAIEDPAGIVSEAKDKHSDLLLEIEEQNREARELERYEDSE